MGVDCTTAAIRAGLADERIEPITVGSLSADDLPHLSLLHAAAETQIERCLDVCPVLCGRQISSATRTNPVSPGKIARAASKLDRI